MITATPDLIRQMSDTEAVAFAADVRQFIIERCAVTGGHLGANLGTIELTIALHRAFHWPYDTFIWDTGHQGYTHKIITGHAAAFPTLNTYGGMSRFITKNEEPQDLIESSHAGTAVSVALGLAMARQSAWSHAWTIAIVGDGALSEGMTFEALNHAATTRGLRLLIVINDNGQAIWPNVGALADAFRDAKARDIFEGIGFDYATADGHSIAGMTLRFRQVTALLREMSCPVVMKVSTEQGHGYLPAVDHPFKMHYTPPFDVATGAPLDTTSAFWSGYQDVCAMALADRMDHDDTIVVITPATINTCGFRLLQERHPSRAVNVGMEEQHAVTLALGLSLGGQKPVLLFQSTFLQRAYDQLFHDICFNNVPVLILAFRSGLAGYDNPTHHGIYDFSYLSGLPNLRIWYPKDGPEAKQMIRRHFSMTGPTLICMPYGPVGEPLGDGMDVTIPEFLKVGSDITILAVGNKVRTALQVAARVPDCGVVNIRQLKPLGEHQVRSMLRTDRIVTLEEHVLSGGIGSAIAAIATDINWPGELLRIGLPTSFIEAGSNDELSHVYGLDAASVEAKIRQRWHRL